MKQVAIVTGASGNLGQAVVNFFLEKNIKVIGTVSPHDNLINFQNQPDFEQHPLDVTREEACKLFVDQVIKNNTTIDVAALLVGGFAMGNVFNTDGSGIKKMFTLNFESAYYLAREIFTQMTKQPSGGHIFLVGARPALVAEAGKNMIAYSLSKALIFKLAELLNAEGNKKNVITSVIVPSILDTPQNRSAMPHANFSDWVSPEDVAEIIGFTISNAAKPLREPVIKVYGNA